MSMGLMSHCTKSCNVLPDFSAQVNLQTRAFWVKGTLHILEDVTAVIAQRSAVNLQSGVLIKVTVLDKDCYCVTALN